MKKLLTMGILGVMTLAGLSTNALADDCATEQPTVSYVQPVSVGYGYPQGWQARRAAEQRRIAEQARLDELRRQAELRAQIEARRVEAARRAEWARLERQRTRERHGRLVRPVHHRYQYVR